MNDIHVLEKVAATLIPGAQLVDTKQTFFSHLGFFSASGSKMRVLQQLLPHIPCDNEDFPRVKAATETFITELSARNIALPEMDLVLNEQGLFMISDYAGPDLLEYLSGISDLTKVESVLEELVLLIQGALLQDQDEPVIGLDLQLSNFGINGGLAYLDPFPPLVRTENELWVHYPQPVFEGDFEKELNRKFRRFGTLRRLRADLMKLNPAYADILNRVLVSVLGTVGQEVVEKFEELPDKHILHISKPEAIQIVTELGTGDKDTLRELAGRLIPLDGNRSKNMHHMFCLSRADSSTGYEQSHKERVEMLKKWLISLL